MVQVYAPQRSKRSLQANSPYLPQSSLLSGGGGIVPAPTDDFESFDTGTESGIILFDTGTESGKVIVKE